MRLVLIIAMLGFLGGCTAYMLGGGASGTAGGNGDRPAAVSSADAAITSRVQSGLKADPVTASAAIAVKTIDGIVFLSGAVADYKVRERADQLARGTSGVQGVNNRLVIQDRN